MHRLLSFVIGRFAAEAAYLVKDQAFSSLVTALKTLASVKWPVLKSFVPRPFSSSSEYYYMLTDCKQHVGIHVKLQPDSRDARRDPLLTYRHSKSESGFQPAAVIWETPISIYFEGLQYTGHTNQP